MTTISAVPAQQSPVWILRRQENGSEERGPPDNQQDNRQPRSVAAIGAGRSTTASKANRAREAEQSGRSLYWD